jgi:RNA polymerase sigma factor (TIGR02999 family)
MRQERPDQTLQATALVHEAYLRLVNQSAPVQWDGRWHFFAAAAEAMRRILVEHARHRSRVKRGGRMQRVSLDDAPLLTIDQPPDELLSLDEALNALAEKHPEKARLVNLRFFAGLSIGQAAEALGISTATADRHWAYARAWLYRRMGSA